MPYIHQSRRDANNPLKMSVPGPDGFIRMITQPIGLLTVGELNFAITTLMSEYVRRRPLSYAVLNDVVGVMTSALAEFQRRVVAPYEDKKCKDNGDVYDCIAGFNDKGNWTCP